MEKSTGGQKVHRLESTGHSKKSTGGLFPTSRADSLCNGHLSSASPALMRSSRQQNEQALRISDRTDRINAMLTVVLNTWFTLRIIVLPKHLWEGIRYVDRKRENVKTTMPEFYAQMEDDWLMLEMFENSRLTKTAISRIMNAWIVTQARDHASAHERMNMHARAFPTNDGRAGTWVGGRRMDGRMGVRMDGTGSFRSAVRRFQD